MKECFTTAELQQLGDSSIVDFDKRIASIPDDLCGQFHQEARQLETELLTFYKIVAIGTKKVEDLTAIATAWKAMVEICDKFANRLRDLTEKHPFCGAQYYYDRVLDLRNKCNRLQLMHS
ncbi:MAG TPA: hypothetical protein VMF08_18290 [Candidatus Sulfotelmatobacter sp.]|nr:hypothetical protein [Candidatus Sulfotelmatobacter sp.]